jgi:A/G-specific adenine glycosylase
MAKNTQAAKTGLAEITAPLLDWYDKNARVLPWRENTEPYRVWVSEIMLQQTRVEAVIPYYLRFMAALPTVEALAEADEARLMKLWEGLGYYSRARNLQKAARQIVAAHGGRFPKDFAEIRALPGIGPYTAGAIASISFGQPTPAVDGNVLRVLARLTGSERDIAEPAVKEESTELLRSIYPAGRCGDFTQSLMELGATVCLPKAAPRCEVCPLSPFCSAYRDGTQAALPVKSKKAPRVRALKTVFLLRCADKLALRQRAADGLLGGLWEFPNAEGHLRPEEAAEQLANWGVAMSSLVEGPRRKHIFTHVEWEMVSFIADCAGESPGFHWVTRQALAEELALPSAFRPFLNAL